LIVLLLEHPVTTLQERETIDASYIAKVLSNDWGFYYDATINLEKVKEIALNFESENKLIKEQINTLFTRIEKLREIIENTPKTRNFLNRDKKGTSTPWYKDVEEVER